jgi:hypothetical protein
LLEGFDSFLGFWNSSVHPAKNKQGPGNERLGLRSVLAAS